MQKLIISLIVLVCTTAFAGVPPASDYDKAPEDVFLDSLALPNVQAPPNIASYPLHMQGHVDLLPDDSLAFEKLSYDVDWTTPINAVDWTTLVELNRQGSQAWNALLACYAGDQNQLRANYLRAQICPQVAPQLKAFRKSVDLFLSSTMIAEPFFTSYLHYRNVKSDSGPNNPWMNNLTSFNAANVGMLGGYNPNLTGTHQFEPAKSFAEQNSLAMMTTLDALPAPQFNPLLIQLLMEHVAAGYPLNYGTYTCSGITCVTQPFPLVGLFTRQRMILETDDLHWGVRGVSYDSQDTADRSALLASVQALLGNGQLPNISPDLSVKLQLLRQAKIAVRLLNFMDVGALQCSDWGLWPVASVELLGMLAQSNYQINGAVYQPTDLRFLAVRLARACHHPIPWALIEPGAMDREGDMLGGPEALSRIGAWRTLVNRFDQQ